MKRLLMIFLTLLMLIPSVAKSESSRTDDAVVFLNAIDVLKHINSKESVEEAHQMLAGITSNYNQANMFRTYAAAIIDIYDDSFDDAQTKLDVLALNEQFNSMLEKYELQSCEVVGRYISARRAENEGRYSDAFEIYTSINFLDSLDRSIELAGKSKEEAYAAAEALFEQGMYVEAAEAFDALGQYKDSAARASESRARVTPEPTPSPTPTPSPSPTPTPNPIVSELDLRSLEVCRICYDLIDAPSFGKNDNNKSVWCCVAFSYFKNCSKEPTIIKTSWCEKPERIEYGMCNDSLWENLKNGRTAYMSTVFEGNNAGLEVFLPNDRSIEGPQEIIVSVRGQTIQFKIQLRMIGDYTTGSGWDIIYQGFELLN